MSQDGFGVDYEKLQAAVKDLEAARDEADQLATSSSFIGPDELTAKDDITDSARQAFQARMSGSEGSLVSAANDIRLKLDKKIEAYKEVLREYGLAEDNASVAQRNTDRES
ncbi:hypothetical protein SAMN04487905_11954 [Actinopolyspora xinjiangensis]|uniref:PE family protein n=1 Tax=Actinopolyspora xinjiangensis TaxID=405564 RepID=A0A1H0WZT7_9ACTN|nr:hypothetical protein [Actinopolyspora xinjiangensis]SDP96172.1 hypothetical protein SAMN04487905_11954 [Actinopolyspora xinjiangensis]